MLGNVGYKHQVTINTHRHMLSGTVRGNSCFFVYEEYFTEKHSHPRWNILQFILP